jgi:cellulose synthase/poly-beta-1,6-N-acetylglucosamine synthase-like glycosyltransferase
MMARSFGGFIRRSNIAAVPLPDSIRRIVARRPLDWSRGSGRARAMPPPKVEVIVPVYGAAKELRACLESLMRETRHRVTLVVDGPQDAAVESVIADFAVRVLRNEQRLGFVGSVNRGMRETSSDVVLLNSDTIVTPRWIEKLIDAAYSSGDVGTVTPLSNHATLCSIPRAFEENLLPTGFDAASFAAVVENVSQRSYPRIAARCSMTSGSSTNSISDSATARKTISACGRWREDGCTLRTTPRSSTTPGIAVSARRVRSLNHAVRRRCGDCIRGTWRPSRRS